MVAERGLEARVKVYQSGCLGGCEFGPMAMTFPDGSMQFGVSAADLPSMLDSLADEAADETPWALESAGPGD